uniref:Uncharacterized protein n=1 Tax=viral metagenome TaxID=1070528 RepID=A0A6M3LU47_9ZZZZ
MIPNWIATIFDYRHRVLFLLWLGRRFKPIQTLAIRRAGWPTYRRVLHVESRICVFCWRIPVTNIAPFDMNGWEW